PQPIVIVIAFPAGIRFSVRPLGPNENDEPLAAPTSVTAGTDAQCPASRRRVGPSVVTTPVNLDAVASPIRSRSSVAAPRFVKEAVNLFAGCSNDRGNHRCPVIVYTSGCASAPASGIPSTSCTPRPKETASIVPKFDGAMPGARVCKPLAQYALLNTYPRSTPLGTLTVETA